MGVRFLCALTFVFLGLVLCDKQTTEDPHTCIRPVSVPKTKLVYVKCSRTSHKICSRSKTVYVKVNKTVCCEGWVFSDERKCTPKCDRGCNRGTCVAPETCACDPPLILKHNISCEEPQCNPSCVNGICVDDDKCSCNAEFTVHNSTHCAPQCPDGFFNDPHTLECQPKCDKCVNGTCTAPDTCTCNEGYTLWNSTCIPHCNQSCKNGKCIAPNTCECSKGYSIDAANKSLCHPICDQCDHGECVAPNQCLCLDGYFKKDGETCTPVCSKKCLNGHCSAPNTCKCDKGYELNSQDTFKCEPVCKDSCINATCSSPGTCVCYTGFEKVNSSVCKPLCASCEHGVCVAPEDCRCDDGFIRTNETCMPVCSSPCTNGFCESPGKCACNEGYFEIESICHKPCIGECDNGVCSVNGECICNFGYELFNNSCMIPESCDKCNGTCPDCRCDDGRPCLPPKDEPAEAAPSTSLAGLQITWLLGACMALLLVTITVITIGIIWRKRKGYGDTPNDDGKAYRSVLFTIPDTLIQRNYGDNKDPVEESDDEDAKDAASVHLVDIQKSDAER